MVNRPITWLAVLGLALTTLPAAEAVRLRFTQVVYGDPQGVGLSAPEDVACTDDGLVWVADTGNGRIIALAATAEGYAVDAVVSAPEVSRPQRIEPGPDGSLYVLDGKQRRIGRVDRSGSFLGWADPSGPQAPKRVVPRGFDVDRSGKLYVLDVASEQILVYAPDGPVERLIDFPESFGFLSDIAVDTRGSVFAVDSVEARVFWAAPDAERLVGLTEAMTEDMDFPTDIAADSAGRVFLSDQHGGGVVILGADGSFRGRQSTMGWGEGLLRYPAGLCVGPRGELFVADRGNSRVQVFEIRE